MNSAAACSNQNRRRRDSRIQDLSRSDRWNLPLLHREKMIRVLPQSRETDDEEEWYKHRYAKSVEEECHSRKEPACDGDHSQKKDQRRYVSNLLEPEGQDSDE